MKGILTISRSSSAVRRASSSSDASCALVRASFISTESGLNRIASMTPGSRSVILRMDALGAVAPSALDEEFSMPQRRRLCMFLTAHRHRGWGPIRSDSYISDTRQGKHRQSFKVSRYTDTVSTMQLSHMTTSMSGDDTRVSFNQGFAM